MEDFILLWRLGLLVNLSCLWSSREEGCGCRRWICLKERPRCSTCRFRSHVFCFTCIILHSSRFPLKSRDPFHVAVHLWKFLDKKPRPSTSNSHFPLVSRLWTILNRHLHWLAIGVLFLVFFHVRNFPQTSLQLYSTVLLNPISYQSSRGHCSDLH